jgi:hypothetical protein
MIKQWLSLLLYDEWKNLPNGRNIMKTDEVLKVRKILKIAIANHFLYIKNKVTDTIYLLKLSESSKHSHLSII